MALYNFQKRFAPKILTGEKRHTIRAKRKRATKPGEMLHLYTGLRQKGAQLLMRTRCTKVQEIEIRPFDPTRPAVAAIFIDGVQLSVDEMEQLARADGFNSLWQMSEFWEGRLPFRGDIIHWHFSPLSHTHSGDGPCANVSAQIVRNSSREAIVSAQKNAVAPTTTTSAKPCVKQSAPAKRSVPSAG